EPRSPTVPILDIYDSICRTMKLQHECIEDALGALAEDRPAAPALQAPGRKPLTYADLAAQIHRVRKYLGGLDIGRGDIVAGVIPSRPEMAVACATLPASSTFAPLSPSLTPRLCAIGRSHGREGNSGTERGGPSVSRGSAAARDCGNRRCGGARCTRRSVHARSRPGRGLASQPDASASAARLHLGVLGYDGPAEAHSFTAPPNAALRERGGRVARIFAARRGLSSHAHASWERLAQRMVESASKRSIDRLPS